MRAFVELLANAAKYDYFRFSFDFCARIVREFLMRPFIIRVGKGQWNELKMCLPEKEMIGSNEQFCIQQNSVECPMSSSFVSTFCIINCSVNTLQRMGR